jgi:hypothetical protein
MKFFASSNPGSFLSGASIKASLIVIVSPSLVTTLRVSPSITLVTVPPKFIVEVVTVSEFEEVAQTWFEKVNVPKTPRKVNIFM